MNNNGGHKGMIGIVGGVGPQAGVDLFNKIIEETHAEKDQDHLPVILWSQPNVIPDRTEYLEGKVKQNPAIPIANIILQLEKAGATVVAIPCNTAHAPVIFEKIRSILKENNSRVTLVSLIDVTIAYLQNKIKSGASIGVLSTTGTWKNKIYRNPLQASGFDVLDAVNLEEQTQIHAAIYDKKYGIKAQSAPISEKAQTILHEAATSLIKRGAQAVILGCTEIPLAIREKDIDGISMIDNLRLLARELIRNIDPDKLKNNHDS